jgi:hypothetical protein
VLPIWSVLVLKIVLGAAIYAALAQIFRLDVWREMKEILIGYLPKRK